MSFNESNTVEQMILDALGAKGAKAGSTLVLHDQPPGWGASLGKDMASAAGHPATWEYVPASDLPRQSRDVMVESWLRTLPQPL